MRLGGETDNHVKIVKINLVTTLTTVSNLTKEMSLGPNQGFELVHKLTTSSAQALSLAAIITLKKDIASGEIIVASYTWKMTIPILSSRGQ